MTKTLGSNYILLVLAVGTSYKQEDKNRQQSGKWELGSYRKEESRKEHKTGSGKGQLDYCEIKENTGGSGTRRKRLKQARDQESGERAGHRGNIGTSEIRRKRN